MIRAILLSVALVTLVALPAMASTEAEKCESASMQLDKEFGKRFDKQAAEARTMSMHARSLQKQGKHAEALQVYEAAAKAGGVHLMYPK